MLRLYNTFKLTEFNPNTVQLSLIRDYFGRVPDVAMLRLYKTNVI